MPWTCGQAHERPNDTTKAMSEYLSRDELLASIRCDGSTIFIRS